MVAHPRARQVALSAHRYVGLMMSVFLIVAGATGSIVAFYPQIDRFINPELLAVEPPYPGAPLLDPFIVRERLMAQLPPGQSVEGVMLQRTSDLPFNYWIDEREVFVDQYTGALKGSRHFGDLSEGRVNWITFLYRFHFTLGLGEVGRVLFGIVALLWTLDCFVGAYLTFPPALRDRSAMPQRSWLVRWVPSWLMRTSKLFSAVFTGHRAGGLWLWVMFLVFAWSAVALNLRDEVYQPLMNRAFGEHQSNYDQLSMRTPARPSPRLSLRQAHGRARHAAQELVQKQTFTLFDERSLHYEPERGIYVYGIESSLDVSSRLAETYLYIDGDDGRLLGFDARTGKHAGTTITSWLIGLHFGALRGEVSSTGGSCVSWVWLWCC